MTDTRLISLRIPEEIVVRADEVSEGENRSRAQILIRWLRMGSGVGMEQVGPFQYLREGGTAIEAGSDVKTAPEKKSRSFGVAAGGAEGAPDDRGVSSGRGASSEAPEGSASPSSTTLTEWDEVEAAREEERHESFVPPSSHGPLLAAAGAQKDLGNKATPETARSLANHALQTTGIMIIGSDIDRDVVNRIHSRIFSKPFRPAPNPVIFTSPDNYPWDGFGEKPHPDETPKPISSTPKNLEAVTDLGIRPSEEFDLPWSESPEIPEGAIDGSQTTETNPDVEAVGTGKKGNRAESLQPRDQGGGKAGRKIRGVRQPESGRRDPNPTQAISKVVNSKEDVARVLPLMKNLKGCSECGGVNGMHQKGCKKGK